MMNKTLLLALLLVVACDRKPFVEHKLQFEKLTDDCANLKPYFRMVSNFGGERFEFEKCLPDNFSKDNLKSSRQGDTVVVTFDKVAGAKPALFKLTLDIDSYPKYSAITIDGETYMVVQAQN